MLRKKKGQSTLEYIAVFTAITAAILFFAYTKLKPAVDRVLTSSANSIEDAADRFDPSEVIP
jgi:hypothetical protein